MRGQPKGQFVVTQSNGSLINGQQPSMRVRLASSGVVVAHIQSGRSNLVQFMRNNLNCPERRMLAEQLFVAGYSQKELIEILSK